MGGPPPNRWRPPTAGLVTGTGARLSTRLPGVAHAAWQAGVAVAPIVIRSAGEPMRRAPGAVRAGRVNVRVHEPIAVGSWKARDLKRHVPRAAATTGG